MIMRRQVSVSPWFLFSFFKKQHMRDNSLQSGGLLLFFFLSALELPEYSKLEGAELNKRGDFGLF